MSEISIDESFCGRSIRDRLQEMTTEEQDQFWQSNDYWMIDPETDQLVPFVLYRIREWRKNGWLAP